MLQWKAMCHHVKQRKSTNVTTTAINFGIASLTITSKEYHHEKVTLLRSLDCVTIERKRKRKRKRKDDKNYCPTALVPLVANMVTLPNVSIAFTQQTHKTKCGIDWEEEDSFIFRFPFQS